AGRSGCSLPPRTFPLSALGALVILTRSVTVRCRTQGLMKATRQGGLGMDTYRLLALGAALTAVPLAAPALGAGRTPLTGTPLPSGWVEYDPGGQTICARGAPFAFFVHPGQ